MVSWDDETVARPQGVVICSNEAAEARSCLKKIEAEDYLCGHYFYFYERIIKNNHDR
jgi:hypothetical protein